MALVDDNQVEEVFGKGWQPALHPLRELMDIRDDDVGLLGIAEIGITVEQRQARDCL